MNVKQVKFKVIEDSDEIFGGIMVDNEYIICGCCGAVFEIDDVIICKIYESWLNISEEIIGED